MRILYHHRTQGEEPESIHIESIVRALERLGHEVRIVGPAGSAQVGHAGRRSLLGRVKRLLPRLAFELLQLGYNILVYAKLARAVREFKPDLIYERYALYNFAGVLLARRRRIPFILEVNTPYAQAWTQYYGLYFKRLARWIERRILMAADHNITVTEVQRSMLTREGIPAARLTVCHNAIDPDWFDPARHDATTLRRTLALKRVVIGFVGTMNRWQGIPEFAIVLRRVLSARSDVSFVFVGDGEYRSTLAEVCRREGFDNSVVFTGRKRHAEIPPLVAAMDIAVLLNSNAYGSPMKIFEYLAMQKAVVAPSVGPVAEVVRDGDTALLITPGDAEQMADRILILADDAALRQRLGSAGRRLVVARHTWQQNARHIVETHRALTNRAARASLGAESGSGDR